MGIPRFMWWHRFRFLYIHIRILMAFIMLMIIGFVTFNEFQRILDCFFFNLCISAWICFTSY